MATATSPHGALTPGVLKRTLYVVSPQLHGDDVLAVQKALSRLGYSPGVSDGVYGPATASAVSEFQRDHHLEVDGAVGPKTRTALEHAEPGSHPPAQPSGSAIGRKALAEAIEHLGEKESPAGSNRTSFGRWFGVDGVPWCNIFVSYCFKVGANYTICHGQSGAGVYAKGCAYVPTTEAWLRSSGQWVGRATPRAGDIAIFNWDTAGVPEHIGIVEKSLGGGKFISVEGNTAVGNDSNGGQVMRRERSISQVDGFGRVG